jgi:hypothetical protein
VRGSLWRWSGVVALALVAPACASTSTVPDHGVHDLAGGPPPPDISGPTSSAPDGGDGSGDDADEDKDGWVTLLAVRGLAVDLPGLPDSSPADLFGTDVDAEGWVVGDPSEAMTGIWVVPAFTNDLSEPSQRVAEVAEAYSLVEGFDVVEVIPAEWDGEPAQDVEVRVMGGSVAFLRVIALSDGRTVLLQTAGPAGEHEQVEADFKRLVGSLVRA